MRGAFAVLADYLSVIIGNNPHESIGAVLGRPDIAFEMTGTLESAQDAAEAAVRQTWDQHGGPPDPALEQLVADARGAWSPPYLGHVIAVAFASVPLREFIPGVTEPGTSPVMESVAERATAVRAAVAEFARRAAFRNSLSIDVAAGLARTEFLLANARATGEVLYKRWRAHVDRPTCCHWCRNLDGRTIPLSEDFAPYLGPAADLSGHGHLTHPPRVWSGRLPGPKLHPHCQCWLEIVTSAVSQPGGQGHVERTAHLVPGYLAAADIRAMPEPKYNALTAFLRAAVHELGQVVRRLAHARRHP